MHARLTEHLLPLCDLVVCEGATAGDLLLEGYLFRDVVRHLYFLLFLVRS
jgi:hypothetical protein